MNMNALMSTTHQGDCHRVLRVLKLARNASNRLLLTSGLLLALLFAPGCQTSNSTGAKAAMFPPARTKEEQAAMTPQQALAELEAGNARFVAGRSQVRNLP